MKMMSMSSFPILKLKPETTFAEITTYPVGTNVCLESCCAWVPKALQDTIVSMIAGNQEFIMIDERRLFMKQLNQLLYQIL